MTRRSPWRVRAAAAVAPLALLLLAAVGCAAEMR